MNDTRTKSDYMLLFRGTTWDKHLAPEQVEKVISDWYAWFDGLMKSGQAISGHPLLDEGKMVTGKNRAVADGPFAESKEAIGGYFYLQVTGMEEALEIAKRCPGLDYGVTVEVRPVAPMCTVRMRALENASAGELATAAA
jgi:hypothetical protein